MLNPTAKGGFRATRKQLRYAPDDGSDYSDSSVSSDTSVSIVSSDDNDGSDYSDESL